MPKRNAGPPSDDELSDELGDNADIVPGRLNPPMIGTLSALELYGMSNGRCITRKKIIDER